MDRATQGKMASTKTVRARRIRKEQLSSRTGIANLLIVCGAIQNIAFGPVLHSLGLLWSEEDPLVDLVRFRTPRNDKS